MGLLFYVDGQYPSFDAMDYVPEEMTIITETPPPEVQPPPDPPDAPEVSETADLGVEEQPCPAPGQPRLGDLSQSGDEKVIGHELQGTTCVVLYEPTTAIEKFLPSTNVVTTTAVIAICYCVCPICKTPSGFDSEGCETSNKEGK